jgi:thymidine kinase
MSKLYFRYAAMNSGKSTLLLQAAYNYAERGMEFKLFTAELDNRNGVGVISSRLGIQRAALTYYRDTDFDQSVLDAATVCLFIDEAQFLTASQVQQLHRLAHASKVPIIYFGLRTDFMGRPFEGAATLLALADDLQELKAICDCGKKASINARLDSASRRVFSGAQILIGGNGKYLSMCPDCFYRETPAARQGLRPRQTATEDAS